MPLGNAFAQKLYTVYDQSYKGNQEQMIDDITKETEQYNFRKLYGEQYKYISNLNSVLASIDKNLKVGNRSFAISTFTMDYSAMNRGLFREKYMSQGISTGDLDNFIRLTEGLKRNMIEGYSSGMRFSQDMRKSHGLSYSFLFLDEKGESLKNAYTLSESAMNAWMNYRRQDFGINFNFNKGQISNVSLGFSARLTSDSAIKSIEAVKAKERHRIVQENLNTSILDEMFQVGMKRQMNANTTKMIDLTTLQQDYQDIMTAMQQRRIIKADTGSTNISSSRLTELFGSQELIDGIKKSINAKNPRGGVQKFMDRLPAFAGSDVEYADGTETSIKTFTNAKGMSPNIISSKQLNNLYEHFYNVRDTKKTITDAINRGKKGKLDPIKDRTQVINEATLKAKRQTYDELIGPAQRAIKAAHPSADSRSLTNLWRDALSENLQNAIKLDGLDFLMAMYDQGIEIDWEAFREDCDQSTKKFFD